MSKKQDEFYEISFWSNEKLSAIAESSARGCCSAIRTKCEQEVRKSYEEAKIKGKKRYKVPCCWPKCRKVILKVTVPQKQPKPSDKCDAYPRVCVYCQKPGKRSR